MDASSFAAEWAGHWLPRAPLAGDVKGPAPVVRRHSRAAALERSHIEANPLVIRSLVVTDHDGADADQIAGLAGLPAPSYVAMNPHTRSGHIVYALATPVCLTDAARRRPMNLLARVETGLCQVLDGDPGYAGRLTRNPWHTASLPLWGPSGAAYGLGELATALGALEALPRYQPRTVLTRSAIGRNCALFDLTRRWAYRAWRRHCHDATEWEQVVHAYAWDRNQAVIGEEFTRGPLDALEVTHLARSVARWTWRTFWHQGGPTAYDNRFTATQAARGRQNRGKPTSDKKRAANTAHGFQTQFDPDTALQEALR